MQVLSAFLAIIEAVPQSPTVGAHLQKRQPPAKLRDPQASEAREGRSPSQVRRAGSDPLGRSLDPHESSRIPAPLRHIILHHLQVRHDAHRRLIARLACQRQGGTFSLMAGRLGEHQIFTRKAFIAWRQEGEMLDERLNSERQAAMLRERVMTRLRRGLELRPNLPYSASAPLPGADELGSTPQAVTRLLDLKYGISIPQPTPGGAPAPFRRTRELQVPRIMRRWFLRPAPRPRRCESYRKLKGELLPTTLILRHHSCIDESMLYVMPSARRIAIGA